MQLQDEQQLLDITFRKQVIKDILSDENQERKREMKKRYDILKDGTKKFVMERMEKELSPETFEEVKFRASNISLFRKIVDKKAMVYKEGAKRNAEAEEYAEFVGEYVDQLNHNSKMKKTNKYLEAFRNCIYMILPYKDPHTQKMKLRSQVLAPYLYDIIEDQENREIPRVLVLSYQSNEPEIMMKEPGQSGKRGPQSTTGNYRSSDGVDQSIADSPDDGNDPREFVFWSTNFHFTCDRKGNIIPGKQEDDLSNPIKTLPFVNFAKDQDGQFWAVGGDDLIEGAILVNTLLTDMHFIAKMQGMGIFYLIGKNIPKTLKIGPSDAIIMEKREEDPDAQIGFASSNPPLDAHMKMIEQYIALLLSTNNLEPGTIKGELSATSAASGIQEMIRKSENMDDIEDQRETYRDNEPLIFDIISRWHNLLFERGVIDDELKMLGSIVPEKIRLEFTESNQFMTEKDKLDVIEKRLELGLDTMIDAVMRDNPDLTKEQAEDKLKELLAEKLEKQRQKLKLGFDNGQESNEESEVDEPQPLEKPKPRRKKASKRASKRTPSRNDSR